jgi:SulP family sulfate permease
VKQIPSTPNTGLLASLRQDLHPRRLLPSLTCGLISGIISVTSSLSFGALIFSGKLSPLVGTGVGLVLFSAVVVGIVVPLFSSFPGTVTKPQEASAALQALIAASIAASMPAVASTEELKMTTVAALALTSILTGACFAILGYLKLGNFVRFIPYPVVGGFLAGTGWLLASGSISLMSDLPFRFASMSTLFTPLALVKWLPGVGFGVALFLILRRFRHFLLLPGMLLGAIALFYLVLLVTGTPVSEAGAQGLLLGPFPKGNLWQPLQVSNLSLVHWQVVLPQLGNGAIVMLISTLALLLNTTSMELAFGQDINLNRELEAAGVANLLGGMGGGVIGFHSLSLSSLSHRMGISSRLAGLISAGFGALILFLGASTISLVPRFVLGGIVLLLGLEFLVGWVYDARRRLPRADYVIVLLILAVITTTGFLQGVALGLVFTIALFVINYSRTDITRHSLSAATHSSKVVRSPQQLKLLRQEGQQVEVLVLQGYIFFGTANQLLTQIRQRAAVLDSQRSLRFLILDFRLVTGLDSSAVLSLTRLRQLAEKQEFQLVFSHLEPELLRQLQLADCLRSDDPLVHFFPDLDRSIEWCEEQILGTIPWRRRRSLPLALQLDELFPDSDQVSTFMDYLEELDVEPGYVLFPREAAPDAIYFIESGRVTSYMELENGQTLRLRTIGAGSIVGEMNFYLQTPHETSVIADEPSTLFRLSAHSLQKMKQDAPLAATTFQDFVLHWLSERLSWAYREVADLWK